MESPKVRLFLSQCGLRGGKGAACFSPLLPHAVATAVMPVSGKSSNTNRVGKGHIGQQVPLVVGVRRTTGDHSRREGLDQVAVIVVDKLLLSALHFSRHG